MLVCRGGRHKSKALYKTHGGTGFSGLEKAQRKNMQRKETEHTTGRRRRSQRRLPGGGGI